MIQLKLPPSILAALAFAPMLVAETPPSTEPAPKPGTIPAVGEMPAYGAVVPAPRVRRMGVGISGPGAQAGPRWELINRDVTGSAVKEKLLPPLKPILDARLRNPFISLGGDGKYYMTGTSGDDPFDYNDGVELWRSTDLQTWEYVGLIWSFEKDGTWQKKWRYIGRPVRAIWSPRVQHIKGDYYLTLTTGPDDRGILKSKTKKPEGPYENVMPKDGYLRGNKDASLFVDDDGEVYIVYGGGWIAKMKSDMSGLAEEPRRPELKNPDLNPAHHRKGCVDNRQCKDIGNEAPFLFKRDGKYYLTAADEYEGRYSSVAAIADTIYGPYDMRHEAVPCGGGTNYFKDKDGRWWCTFFGNDNHAPWRERPGLVSVEFEKDGRIKVAKEQPQWVLDKTRK